LLGTVVGIIASFQNIAKEGSGGLAVVSGGISEALIVTAFGLLVAIPSVLAFNMLTGRADKLVLEIERSRGELLDHMEHTEESEPQIGASRAA
jgi:biopolymer transport protein ExbB